MAAVAAAEALVGAMAMAAVTKVEAAVTRAMGTAEAASAAQAQVLAAAGPCPREDY